MKKLQLRFKTAEGHKKNLVLNYVKADLTPEEVKAGMAKISTSNIFEQNTVQLYKEVLGASYIERIETKAL
ncbi:DUF2922 domain-containing protein [Companilactobacillus nantensis]|uniref:DUF2922 domain-containing protein n=1 Tax=Companilactobacillus nantensis DSM 16982 TaxID=1423774 RepID=A0A0R1WC35_9LACO|nr:DUF2922 domain-containing protein [Companilactobacillus nantensis]KRM15504.1 hypothetical protein FD31_GL001220 [Companilactobacillus nantensis DSM 16982]GEO64935.1 hypothetical protein LNA01_21180 [Companilactobacillus nantensis]